MRGRGQMRGGTPHRGERSPHHPRAEVQALLPVPQQPSPAGRRGRVALLAAGYPHPHPGIPNLA